MYKDFTEMPVWQKSLEIVKQAYLLIDKLPKYEQFALATQIRNAAVSIPANISEGFGRHHSKDKINFYYYSRGSSFELRSHFLCAIEVNYFSEEETSFLKNKCLEVEKKLNHIIQALKP